MYGNTSPIKYIAYLRKSSEQDDRQALSLSSQKDDLENLVQREGLDIIEWVEEAKSAKQIGRPLFQEVVKKIENGEAKGLLVWSPDRITRNILDMSTIIALMDAKKLIEVKTVQGTYHNTPIEQFTLSLACLQAKLENDNKSEHVIKGLKRKANSGWLPSGAPIGYRNTPDKLKGFKTIEKDDERFPIVRRLWDLILTGNYTVSHIYEIAKKDGLTTVPRGKLGGKPLSKSGIYAMLKNPFYYGYFEFPKGSRNWIEGAHEPMILRREFDQVQAFIKRKDMPRPKKLNLPFNGLLRCSNCFGLMSGEVKVKKQKNGNVHHYVFYSCKRHKDKSCKERSIEVKSLLIQAETLLEKLTISENLKSWAIKHVHEIRRNEAESQEILLKKNHEALEVVVGQLDSLMLKYASPENADGRLISPEELRGLKESLLEKKTSLEAKLSLQGKEIENWVELTEKTFNFACYAKTWFQRGDESSQRIILSSLASNLFIKDREMALELHPYFKAIVENKNEAEKEIRNLRTSEKGSIKAQNTLSGAMCHAQLRR